MGQYKQRSQFYRNLATLEEAGVSRLQALRQRYRPPFGRAAAGMADIIGVQGLPLAQAMRQYRRLFSPFECGLVDVGEKTGRLDLVCRALADWFELLARLRSRVITGLIYPIVLYHVAAVVMPGVDFFTGAAGYDQTLRRILILAGTPWAIALLWVVGRAALCPAGMPDFVGLDALILQLPVLGKLAYKLNSARFFRALALALKSGLGTVAAVRAAAQGCTNSYLKRRFQRLADVVERSGCTFAEAFSARSLRHDRDTIVLTMMNTGEMAGAPDAMAERVAKIYSEEAEESLKRITSVVPVLVYLGVALYIGYRIVSFYGKLFEQVNSLL